MSFISNNVHSRTMSKKRKHQRTTYITLFFTNLWTGQNYVLDYQKQGDDDEVDKEMDGKTASESGLALSGTTYY